jgi:bacteriorhodopsin
MELPVLTPGQFDLVYNALSFGIAAMGAGFIFFALARSYVAPAYRPALLVSALVVAIAAYHYVRIFESWGSAYVLEGGAYVPSGEAFNDAYRYIDWLLTVPLLLVEAVAVLALARAKSASLIARLSIAAVLMIVLGYPGEITDNNTARFIWGALSSVPFVYILWVLWGELGRALDRQPPQVRVLVRNLRLLLLGTWGVYPIAYMAPFFGLTGAGAVVAIQLGYTIADVLAKPGFGLLIYAIAREKTRADNADPLQGQPAVAAAAGD